MSNYFKDFPKVDYYFGDETTTTQFQHLGTYLDVIDQIKEYGVYYNTYSIQNGERPDQLSYKLYGSSNYGWTFYLLNDHLRQRGWPIRDADLFAKAQEYYPNTVFAVNGVAQTKEPDIINGETIWLPTDEQIPLAKSTAFVPGNYLYFPNTKLAGKLLKVDQKLGLIWCDVTGVRTVDRLCVAIPESEGLKVIADADHVPVTQYAEMEIVTIYDEFDAPQEYRGTDPDYEEEKLFPLMSSTYPYPFDHKKLVGYRPVFDDQGADTGQYSYQVVSTNPTVNSRSHLVHLREVNDEQKIISILKKDVIQDVISTFNTLLRR